MLQAVLRHTSLLLFALLMSPLSGLSVPALPPSHARISPLPSARDGGHTQHHRAPMTKRSDRAFLTLTRFMTRQSPRHGSERAFVEKMFRLFDMNADEVIERDEFRAILQLLGIVSHTF